MEIRYPILVSAVDAWAIGNLNFGRRPAKQLLFKVADGAYAVGNRFSMHKCQ